MILRLRAEARDVWSALFARPGERGTLLGLAGAALVAWISLAVYTFSGAAAGGEAQASNAGQTLGGMPGMVVTMCGSSLDPAGGAHSSMLLGSGIAAGIAVWTLMVLAMMLPAELPVVAHISAKSLSWRRPRAMATFVIAYISIWVGFGALVIGASSVWAPADGDLTFASSLLIAALWQLAPQKWRALQDCHRSYPLPPRGWAATKGVLSFACRNGAACFRSCWALMLAMGAATSAMLVWMLVISAIVLAERSTRRPRRTARAISVVLVSAALLVQLVELAP